MRVEIKKITQFYFHKDFLSFVIIGGINTFSGIIFSYIYADFLKNVNIAFVFGYITSLILSYVLNSKITFKRNFSLERFVKFVLSYIPNFFIQNIIVFITYNCLGWNKLVAYGLAAMIGIPITFFCMKIMAFKK